MRRRDLALAVECHWDGRRATVVVSGEVDFASAGILARHLDEVTCQEPGQLIVDLSRTSFLDAAGLRVIARVRRVLAPQCPVVLRSPVRQVRMILEISGLAELCTIEDPGEPGRQEPARVPRRLA